MKETTHARLVGGSGGWDTDAPTDALGTVGSAPFGAPMRAVDIIRQGGILLRPKSGSFEEAIRALVDTLIANQRLPVALRDRAVRAVCDREGVASTAIVEIGVSVPHARLAGVAGVVAGLAASPTALYHATPGVPISIMVLVLSAPELIGEHLQTLASVSLLLQSETLRRGLERATDAAAALRILQGDNDLDQPAQ